MKRLQQLLLTAALLLTACTGPLVVRPVVQDGAGRELPLRNELINDLAQVAPPELFETPWDATPDPAGERIYFTASTNAGAGVFRVPAAGGATSVLALGEPLVAPLGLAISSDGEQLFVADAAAGDNGLVWVISAAAGSASPLPGTAGLAPRGVEVKPTADGDLLYFSGTDSADSEPGVWQVATAGGEAQIVAKGAPLVEPVGVAITDEGVVYVADRAASGNGLGTVFRIDDGGIAVIADHIRTGTPVVGATLTLDEAVLLVSALDPQRDSAQVLVIDLASGEQGVVTKVISGNRGAGGIHRAHERNLFAWADSTVKNPAGGRGGGGVYRVAPDKMEAGAEG